MSVQKTESQIQKEILEALQSRGLFCWRNNTGRRGGVAYGHKGSPDIIGMLPCGRFFGVEVKKPGGTQSQHQRAFEKICHVMGGLYILADSLAQVLEALPQSSLKAHDIQPGDCQY